MTRILSFKVISVVRSLFNALTLERFSYDLVKVSVSVRSLFHQPMDE